jgi:hypothetical protein
MPKPVKKAAAKKTPARKRPSSDPMIRARQLMDEQMAKFETSTKPWDAPAAQPAPAPTFEEQFRARMAQLGKKGGKASGAKRMTNLTEKQRRDIAKKAAAARWTKKSPVQS